MLERGCRRLRDYEGGYEMSSPFLSSRPCRYALMYSFIFVAVCLQGCHGKKNETQSNIEYYDTWKMEASYDKLIDNPLQWTADNLRDCPNSSTDTIQTKEIDLDHCGTPELLVTLSGLCARVTPYLVFKRVGKQFRYIGCLGLGLRYKVLPLGKRGEMRVATYERDGPSYGLIEIISHDGEKFVYLSIKRMKEGGAGDKVEKRFRERFREVFGED